MRNVPPTDALPRLTRETSIALVVAGALLVVAHVVVPHWSTRYGAALLVFSIWMVWFVSAFVRWLSDFDG